MRKISRKGKLVLSDGSSYEGDLYGRNNAVGEVVFTTGMSGYQETLTDPSLCGHIVVSTYPVIGNYGINNDFNQSPKCFLQGYIVSELCDHPSNWRCEKTLEEFLDEQDVPVLVGVDTRAITRKLRDAGVLQGAIVPEETSQVEVEKLLNEPAAEDQVSKVTTTKKYTLGTGKYHVAVIDLGVKQSILNYLMSSDCHLTIYPAYTKAEEILADNPDGIFISNGPGNPKDLNDIIIEVKKLNGQKPIFGVCLGHLVLAMANGANTFKMKFGHRGFNHPVKDLQQNKVLISTQNHGYAVEEKSLVEINAEITHISLNDGIIQGIVYQDQPAFSVQYHPEINSAYSNLLERFIMMMGGR